MTQRKGHFLYVLHYSNGVRLWERERERIERGPIWEFRSMISKFAPRWNQLSIWAKQQFLPLCFRLTYIYTFKQKWKVLRGPLRTLAWKKMDDIWLSLFVHLYSVRGTTLDCRLLTDETTHSTNERTVGWLIGWLVGFVSSVVCRWCHGWSRTPRSPAGSPSPRPSASQL